jgi:hypothetical protein
MATELLAKVVPRAESFASTNRLSPFGDNSDCTAIEVDIHLWPLADIRRRSRYCMGRRERVNLWPRCRVFHDFTLNIFKHVRNEAAAKMVRPRFKSLTAIAPSNKVSEPVRRKTSQPPRITTKTIRGLLGVTQRCKCLSTFGLVPSGKKKDNPVLALLF